MRAFMTFARFSCSFDCIPENVHLFLDVRGPLLPVLELFPHVSRQLLCPIRQTWTVLRQECCSHHHASNRGDVTNIDSSLFLTDRWSRQSIRTFQIQRLDNQLRVSRLWFTLNPTPVTIGVPMHVSIEDSQLLGVIATCTKDCPNL